MRSTDELHPQLSRNFSHAIGILLNKSEYFSYALHVTVMKCKALYDQIIKIINEPPLIDSKISETVYYGIVFCFL